MQQELQKKKPQLCEVGEGIEKGDESGKWFKDSDSNMKLSNIYIYI